MKTILCVVLSVFTLSGWGQISFEKGVIINNDGKKTECLIKNKEWAYNPVSFEYKLSENDEIKVGDISTVREFEVSNEFKFVRALVKIDTSRSRVISNYSRSRSPEWRTETLFLKAVVEGNADLYYYETPGLVRFFYRTASDTAIRQLVFKEYFKSDSEIGTNVDFRQQLFSEVKCGNVSSIHFERIGYKVSELKRHFMEYNRCMGDIVNENNSIQPNASRDFLKFKITPGVNLSSLSIENSLDQGANVDFESDLFFRCGLELEYILAFNKNKWAVFIEPSYQTFKSTTVYNTSKASVSYQSIEFPIGVRHYFFLQSGSKLFLNAFLLPGTIKDIDNSHITYGSIKTTPTSTIEIRPRMSFGLGAGYVRGPFSVEARYQVPQNVLGDYLYYKSAYHRLTLIAGYQFLKVKSKRK